MIEAAIATGICKNELVDFPPLIYNGEVKKLA